MKRNLLLTLATIGTLVLLFVAYTQLVRDPAQRGDDTLGTSSLPQGDSPTTAPTAFVSDVPLAPGKAAELVVYDPHTGRAKQRLRFSNWSKSPGGENEIDVTNVEMTLILPSGQTVSIAAPKGRIAFDRPRRGNMQPRSGKLTGGARVVVDRGREPNRPPLAQRPQDALTIAMDSLDFDVPAGHLRSVGAVEVTSAELELRRAAGLEVTWNETENRLELLRLDQGGELTFRGGARHLLAERDTPEREDTTPKPLVGYLCTLGGDVVAQQRRGDIVVTGFEAPHVSLLFDTGGRRSRNGLAASRPASAPSIEPNEPGEPNLPQSMTLTWHGPLLIQPDPNTPAEGEPRRWLTAEGPEVRLHYGTRVVRAGRVEAREESQQAWLYPTADGRVHIGLDDGADATAQSAYIDLAHHVVKLLGPVDLSSPRAAGGPLAVRCDDWAELHLAAAADAAPAADALLPGTDALAFSGLQAARFVGHVELGIAARRLRGENVELRFDPAPGDATTGTGLEARLRGATASGAVELTAAPPTVWAQAGNAWSAAWQTALGQPGAPRPEADQWLVCSALETQFERTPEGTIYPTNLAAEGAVELFDRQQRIAARGRRLVAEFSGPDELSSAEVTGKGALPAWVFADPFAVWGPAIRLDRHDESLVVNGASRLVLTMDRTLQGRSRGKQEPVTVTSSQALRVNAAADKARYHSNVVVFEGDVVAATGDEKLSSRTLALLMRDEEPNNTPAPATSGGRSWTMLSAALRRGLEASRPTPPTANAATAAGTPRVRPPGAAARRAAAAATPRPSLRRQIPTRLVAEQSLVESATRRPGDANPLVESSLSTPQLTVDFDQRVVTTQHGTQLLMISRQMPPEPSAGEPNTPPTSVMGVPSGLMSRGPSQTALKCDGPMTYALGVDGPQRRDFAIFEGNVVFAHAAGRAMTNLKEMGLALADDPAWLAKLESRRTRLVGDRLECEFAADDRGGSAGGSRGALGPLRGAAGPPLRLTHLLSKGNVELRDQQGQGVREVYADRVDYDAASALVAVFGSPTVAARAYLTNPETGALSAPFVGPHLEINLRTNEVRAEGGVSGEVTQPTPPPTRH